MCTTLVIYVAYKPLKHVNLIEFIPTSYCEPSLLIVPKEDVVDVESFLILINQVLLKNLIIRGRYLSFPDLLSVLF